MRGLFLLNLLALLDYAIAQTVTDFVTDTVTVTQSATCPASTGLASETTSLTSSLSSSIYSSISTSISASNSISSLESSLSESMSSVSSSISESLSSLSSSFSITETSASETSSASESTGSPSASDGYRTITIYPSTCYSSASAGGGGGGGGSSPTASSDLSSITSSASLAGTTSSTTSSATSSTSSVCAPQGVQWAYYQNNAGADTDSTYSNFDPTIYKTQTPLAQGTWGNVGGLFLDGTSPTASIYGSSQQLSVDNFALETQGYIVAATTGVYFINITLADDGTFVWLGNDATSGWTRSNAEIAAFYDYRGPGNGYHDWYLTAGSVLPFRTMLAQAGSQAQFKMTVTAPDGTDYMDSYSSPSNNLIQYSCDSSKGAPQYAAWGSQT